MTKSYAKDIQLLLAILRNFRNQIDHVYEKVNKTYLKPFIFSVISKDAIQEIKERIKYCTAQSKNIQ